MFAFKTPKDDCLTDQNVSLSFYQIIQTKELDLQRRRIDLLIFALYSRTIPMCAPIHHDQVKVYSFSPGSKNSWSGFYNYSDWNPSPTISTNRHVGKSTCPHVPSDLIILDRRRWTIKFLVDNRIFLIEGSEKLFYFAKVIPLHVEHILKSSKFSRPW